MDVIGEINEKYSALEAEIDSRLEKIKTEEKKLEKLQEQRSNKSSSQTNKVLSYEESLTRNTNLLKSLEIAKARLRSRSTFSPVEQILEKAIANYKRDLEMAQQSPSRSENVHIYEAPTSQDTHRRDDGDQKK
ncbi:uncharacterized protein [Eurosta solidaginis]|uniref:uncharacterized protein n=1 Tax=Eurosta solidaginis TaxID=178769 RepID=UPI003530DAB0